MEQETRGKIDIIGHTKGGAKKTVTICNLGAIHAHKGRSCIIVDADGNQQTARKWANERKVNGHKPDVPVVSLVAKEPSASDFKEKVLALAERFDHVLIDAGGRDSRELRCAVTFVDRWIVPVVPSAGDVWALQELKGDVIDLLWPTNPDLEFSAFIAGANPLYPQRQVRDTIPGIEEYEIFNYMDVAICDRPIVVECFADGLGVCDLTGEGQNIKNAQQDFITLYNRLYEHE